MSNINWQAIKEEFETGISQRSLALKYNISQAAISKRASKEQWVIAPVITRHQSVITDNVELSELSPVEIVERALADLAKHLEDAPLDLKSHKLFADALSQYIKLKLTIPTEQDLSPYDMRDFLASCTDDELAVIRPIIVAVQARKQETEEKIKPIRRIS